MAEHLGGSAESRRTGQAHAAGRARVHGGAAGGRHRRAVADAGIGGNALVCAVSGAKRQGQGRRVGRRASAEGAENTCRSRCTSTSARQVTDADSRAGEAREPWVLHRDAAVLALLYGSGLRISEALGLARGDVPAPGQGDAITVTGKGNKQRMVPLLPQVSQSIADYIALCPYDLPADGPLFVGARGGAVVAAHRPACHGTVARRAEPAGLGDAARAAPFVRHASARRAAAICAPSRSCSATPRSRPRKSTRLLTPIVCLKSIAAPIRGRDTLPGLENWPGRLMGMRHESRCARGSARGRAQDRA